jgi:hypothetical protein
MVRPKPVVRLYDLSVGSYVYGITDFDESYRALRADVGWRPDLDLAQHRRALLLWLNKWGCRQIQRGQYDRASDELLAWHQACGASLPGADMDLWMADDAQLTASAECYGNLAARVASIRKNGEHVRFGAVGAAKVLFALRPRLLPAWDGRIRLHFGYDESSDSYHRYLSDVRSALASLIRECEQHGFQLSELPSLLDRPLDTVPKLVDMYHWITITRKVRVAPPAMMQRGLGWSRTVATAVAPAAAVPSAQARGD